MGLPKRRFIEPLRKKRSVAEIRILSTLLIKYIRKHPGQRFEAISADLHRFTEELRYPMQQLIRNGFVHTGGGWSRATTYWPKNHSALFVQKKTP